MAPYDSDSSGGEDNDYTETNVLLGYASKEPPEDIISHLGGRPAWLDPTTPPSAALAKCKVCNDLMVLLLQLNGDLPEHFSGHERRLYVLTCRRKTCRRKEGSVRALRGVRIVAGSSKDKTRETAKSMPTTDSPTSKPAFNIGETLFGGKAPSNSAPSNPFSSSSSNAPRSNPFSTASSVAPNNPFAAGGSSVSEPAPRPPQAKSTTTDLPRTFASALSLNNDAPSYGPLPPPEPWPEESDWPPAYPIYYLADADYEILDTVEDPPIPTQTMDLDEGGGSSSQKEDKDVYESTIDKTFQKFADRLAQNPEQVIRYEFKGQPLLYSKHDAVGKMLAGPGKDNARVTSASVNGNRIPRCGNCGSGRVFEVQLTPHAIMELESEESSIDGMEWGTIIVGVCEKDCQEKGIINEGVGYVEEWAGVQWEELNDRGR